MGLFDFLKVKEYQKEITQLKEHNQQMQSQLDTLGATTYFELQEKSKKLESTTKENIEKLESESSAKIEQLNTIINARNSQLENLEVQKNTTASEFAKLNKQIEASRKKLARSKQLYHSMENAITNFFMSDTPEKPLLLIASELKNRTICHA